MGGGSLQLTFWDCSEFTLPPFLPSSSGGPDLLEGHGANGHGADGAGGGPAVPVPAEHHHRGLCSVPGRRMLHHLRADLLRHHPRAQVGRWGAPFQVRAAKCRK